MVTTCYPFYFTKKETEIKKKHFSAILAKSSSVAFSFLFSIYANRIDLCPAARTAQPGMSRNVLLFSIFFLFNNHRISRNNPLSDKYDDMNYVPEGNWPSQVRNSDLLFSSSVPYRLLFRGPAYIRSTATVTPSSGSSGGCV